jgi:tetratricopeptide (TPR) repeat protein
VTNLIRKELLALETDPFSPERGQLGFLQALVQRITYETIARRDRRRRHLAAAQFLATEAGIDPDEIAEVIAAHYLDAHEADPAASDGDDVRGEARRWFTRAAERAASLAASREAQRAFEQAADLAGEQTERGRSLARAGELASMGGRLDEAVPLLEEAIEILSRAGERAEAARAEVTLGELHLVSSRIEEGIDLLEHALAAHEAEGDEQAVASVSVELGRLLFFEERRDEASRHVERALEVSERLRLMDVVVQGLINKGLLIQHRPNESLALIRQALLLAEETGDERGAMRACMNLGFLLSIAGREDESLEVIEHGIDVARRRGDRAWELSLISNLVSAYYVTGRWDDLERVVEELPEEGRITANPVQATNMLELAEVAMRRGDTERVRELVSEYAAWEESTHVQVRGVRMYARVLIAQVDGRHEDAVAECLRGLRDPGQARNAIAVELLLTAGCESALALGSSDTMAELVQLAEAAPADAGPPLAANLALQRARLATLRNEDDAPHDAAVTAFRGLENPFLLATALLEQAEWLVAHGRSEAVAPLVREARATFERLRVPPMLERVAALERLDASSLEAALDG